jgi:dihydrofolate synthase / folylpolyglutamate synthase
MNYNQTIKEIYRLTGSEHKGHFNLSLKNIKLLLKKLKNPEKQLKVIHIAGTNGKGSVCAMLSSILKEANYKVGMYTSPHLKDFRERFLINNKKISKEDLVKYFQKVKPFITSQTFFEVITAMAFLYFRDMNLDFLVCEVGLGGRLDATNVITPLISVITNISLEHQEYLGETIEEIAYEKAGIIKNKIPVITGTSGSALEVIKKTAQKKNATLYTNGKPIKSCSLNLNGDFQLKNASIALKSIKALNQYYNLKITKDAVKNGLLKTIWHGRLEFLSKNILVDCAHNLDAIKALKKEIIKIKRKKLYLIIGILKNKDHKSILKELTPLADEVILVKPKIPRALDPKILAKHVNNPIIIKDTKKALKYAKNKAKKDDLILVTGSIYVVGEVV